MASALSRSLCVQGPWCVSWMPWLGLLVNFFSSSFSSTTYFITYRFGFIQFDYVQRLEIFVLWAILLGVS